MNNEKKETIKVRVISVGFTVLALAVFKPFALRAWQWEAYAHLFALWILGIVDPGHCRLFHHRMRLEISRQDATFIGAWR